MRYAFEAGKDRRVMHIARTNRLGQMLYWSDGGVATIGACEKRLGLRLDRTINAPWGLGRPICRVCLRAAEKE